MAPNQHPQCNPYAQKYATNLYISKIVISPRLVPYPYCPIMPMNANKLQQILNSTDYISSFKYLVTFERPHTAKSIKSKISFLISLVNLNTGNQLNKCQSFLWEKKKINLNSYLKHFSFSYWLKMIYKFALF